MANETEKKKKPAFEVDADGNVIGNLKFGFKIGEVTHKQFVMRPALVSDMIDADNEEDAKGNVAFYCALIARQLVSCGTFNGPFTFGMIQNLRDLDYMQLRAAQQELDRLGEAAAAQGAAG